ncbi:MAG: PhnA protein [Gammaproteobacteria bacterium]|nr:PhnA protein [Gammaproteobacteria bacterium]
MSIQQDLEARSGSICELCAATDDLSVYEVEGGEGGAEGSILVCATCRGQLEDPEQVDVHHWRCLSNSMWTPVPAVQVTAWRMLSRLQSEGWARDLLDTLYLDDETLAWAEAGAPAEGGDDTVKHVDCHGAVLEAGDTVTLVKDLDVKGTSFTAKRGTAVRGIRLVADNPEHIEGKVNGQTIVILTQFVKKS